MSRLTCELCHGHGYEKTEDGKEECSACNPDGETLREHGRDEMSEMDEAQITRFTRLAEQAGFILKGGRLFADRDFNGYDVTDQLLRFSKLLAAAPIAAQEPADPLDTPIPCDLTVGRVTIRKGCKFRTVKIRMEVLHRMAMENTFPGLKDKTPAEAKTLLDDLVAQHVPSAAQAETTYLLSSPANVAHIARSIEQARNGQVQERQLVELDESEPVAWMVERSHGAGSWSKPEIVIAAPQVPFPALMRVTPLYAEAPRAALPEGWKLVPIEPTDDMMQAAWDTSNCLHGTPEGDDPLPRHQYRAMLAAVPPLQLSPSSDAGAVTAPSELRNCAKSQFPPAADQDGRDAKRFRWLAERYTGWDAEWGRDEANGAPGKAVIVFNADPAMRAPFRRSDLAKAIDAAMAGGAE